MKKITLSVLALAILVAMSCKKTELQEEVKLKTFTATIDLAYNKSQLNPACFLDLDSGKVYTVSQADSFQKTIDMVYVLRYFNADDPIFLSMGNFDGKSGYPISDWTKVTLGISDWTNYNHTNIGGANSSMTTQRFASMTNLAELNAAFNEVDNAIHDFKEITNSEVGNIFQFRTYQNKRGYFRLISATNGSSGKATIEIKIEK